MRFGKEFEDRKLRLYFSDGKVCEGLIIDVAEPEDGDGFVFDPIGDGIVSSDKHRANLGHVRGFE